MADLKLTRLLDTHRRVGVSGRHGGAAARAERFAPTRVDASPRLALDLAATHRHRDLGHRLSARLLAGCTCRCSTARVACVTTAASSTRRACTRWGSTSCAGASRASSTAPKTTCANSAHTWRLFCGWDRERGCNAPTRIETVSLSGRIRNDQRKPEVPRLAGCDSAGQSRPPQHSPRSRPSPGRRRTTAVCSGVLARPSCPKAAGLPCCTVIPPRRMPTSSSKCLRMRNCRCTGTAPRNACCWCRANWRHAGQARNDPEGGDLCLRSCQIPHSGVCISATPCVLFIAFESPVDAVPGTGKAG